MSYKPTPNKFQNNKLYHNCRKPNSNSHNKPNHIIVIIISFIIIIVILILIALILIIVKISLIVIIFIILINLIEIIVIILINQIVIIVIITIKIITIETIKSDYWLMILNWTFIITASNKLFPLIKKMYPCALFRLFYYEIYTFQ